MGTGIDETPGFFVRDGRAMVSLGPLSEKRFCTYACAFCYVHAGFTAYPSLTNREIVEYLAARRKSYDIIYVSGDTDSFAPPRTDRGIQLLHDLEALNCDILFTTRAVFSEADIARIEVLGSHLLHTGRLLVCCVSVSRLRSAVHIEPPPIPSPRSRIQQIMRLKDAGLTTVLAVRPFLPIIPADEYVEIVEQCKDHVDLVLGEAWYADCGGVIEKQVLLEQPCELTFEQVKMDFDVDTGTWKVWKGNETREVVEAFCRTEGLPFYMRSRPAVQWLRKQMHRDNSSQA